MGDYRRRRASVPSSLTIRSPPRLPQLFPATNITLSNCPNEAPLSQFTLKSGITMSTVSNELPTFQFVSTVEKSPLPNEEKQLADRLFSKDQSSPTSVGLLRTPVKDISKSPRKTTVTPRALERKLQTQQNLIDHLMSTMEETDEDRGKPQAVGFSRSEIIELFSCPVCLDFLEKKKIVQCLNGHVLCSDCFDHIPSKMCPVCRRLMTGSIRNLFMENFLARLAPQLKQSPDA